MRHALIVAASLALAMPLSAQRGRAGGPMNDANRLDLAGNTAGARAIFQRLLDSATTPLAKTGPERAIAMSYAFDGDCRNVVKYEQMVIAYWATRETEEPQNAFFQQGELANEAARVCLDAGDVATAETWYRKGAEVGKKEPAPQTHPASLWDYRLAHALGRIAARRGDKTEAERQVAAARRILDADSAMAAGQRRFFPYLEGYVALYTNDLATADAKFAEATSISGNQGDPFMRCLFAMTLEKKGEKARADSMYRQAYDLATGHNPPAAFVRPLVRKKLGLPPG